MLISLAWMNALGYGYSFHLLSSTSSYKKSLEGDRNIYPQELCSNFVN
ncbi:hypothetical protein [Nostoc sp. T09]|nr:hypothetical protein [Nostoc sp. T09]